MKKRFYLVAILLFLISCVFIIEKPKNVFAASKVEFTKYGGWGDKTQVKKFAKKLGLKKKTSSKYDVFYSGKKVKIGANNGYAISWPKKCIYIKNSGNKKLTVYGVKIGDSLKSVKKKMKSSYLPGDGKTYGPYYDCYKFKYSNNKLVSWTYWLAYTG